jgi:hypothetical protein
MTWFKVDDGFAMHPKAVAAGNPALGLWVRAGAWSASQLTDGVIPRHMVAALGGRPREAAALVDAGLWLEHVDGWAFHDWQTYQPTRADVEDRRRVRAQAGAKGGVLSGRSRRLKAVGGDEA